jgi:hypothetical protein
MNSEYNPNFPDHHQYAKGTSVDELIQNKATELVEGGNVAAVLTETYSPYRDGDFYFGNDGVLTTAEQGHEYAKTELGHRRVEAETVEAKHLLRALGELATLKSGGVVIMVSPKDVGPEAIEEGINERDMIRVHKGVFDDDGVMVGKTLTTLMMHGLNRPTLDRYLNDRKSNVWQRDMEIQSGSAATSIMEKVVGMDLSAMQLQGRSPEEILKTILSGLVDTSTDGSERSELQQQYYDLSRSGYLKKHIDVLAAEFLEFDIDLYESRRSQRLSEQQRVFLNAELPNITNPQARKNVLYALETSNMNEATAYIVSKLYQNSVLNRAAAIGESRFAVKNMDEQSRQSFEHIRYQENLLYNAVMIGAVSQVQEIKKDLYTNSGKINADVGGGCAGKKRTFNDGPGQEAGFESGSEATNSEEITYKFDKKGKCVVCDPKKVKEEKNLGPCGICKDCDSSIRKKQK